MTTTATTARKMKVIEIALSDRAPVRINPDLWPVLATVKDWDNHLECQANQVWRISVRQHADGRTLVYGVHTRGPGGMPLTFRERHAGFLLEPSGDIVRAIRRVAGAIDADSLADACIADLPAEEI